MTFAFRPISLFDAFNGYPQGFSAMKDEAAHEYRLIGATGALVIYQIYGELPRPGCNFPPSSE
jgi:hypothetical protein